MLFSKLFNKTIDWEALIDRDPFAIRQLTNPSEKLQILAVTKNEEAIRFIQNPSEAVQRAACNRESIVGKWTYGEAFERIAKYITSQVVLREVITQRPINYIYVENISEELQILAAINPDIMKATIQYQCISSKSPINVKLAAVKAFAKELGADLSISLPASAEKSRSIKPMEQHYWTTLHNGSKSICVGGSGTEEVIPTSVIEGFGAGGSSNQSKTLTVENYEEQKQLELIQVNIANILTFPKLTQASLKYLASCSPSTELKIKLVEKDPYLIHYIRPNGNGFDDIENKTGCKSLHAYADLINRLASDIRAVGPCDWKRYLYIPYLQRVAVETDPLNIQYINDPNLDIQLLAVTKQPSVIRFIKDQLGATQLKAFEIEREASKPLIIPFLQKPSELVQAVIVKKNPEFIEYIKHPCTYVSMLAIKAGCFRYIQNPSYEIIHEAINYDPFNIQYVKHPDHQTIVKAIKANKNVASLIKDGQLILKEINEKSIV